MTYQSRQNFSFFSFCFLVFFRCFFDSKKSSQEVRIQNVTQGDLDPTLCPQDILYCKEVPIILIQYHYHVTI